MTNNTYDFILNGHKYLLRMPGENTDKIINRYNEAFTYKTIKGFGFCNDPNFFNEETGIMITKWIPGRVCDPHNWDDVKMCVDKIKELHELKLCVPYEFDVFKQIDFYESLCKPTHSDYEEVKERIFSFKPACTGEKVLCHIDPVSDNFIINSEGVYLIDWEYAAMSDPDIDIAMFAIYAGYSRKDIDRLIDIYDPNKKDKIYCYIAACGLLWSNWCEIKNIHNEYSESQYNYAKEFSK